MNTGCGRRLEEHLNRRNDIDYFARASSIRCLHLVGSPLFRAGVTPWRRREPLTPARQLAERSGA